MISIALPLLKDIFKKETIWVGQYYDGSCNEIVFLGGQMEPDLFVGFSEEGRMVFHRSTYLDQLLQLGGKYLRCQCNIQTNRSLGSTLCECKTSSKGVSCKAC